MSAQRQVFAMPHVFISYSSKHRNLTEKLAKDFEAQGYTVWWDDAIDNRGPFQPQIRAALEEARVVVVIWAAGAMISDWVYAEASRAQEQGKLVNVRPADMSFRDIPEPFNIYHIDEAADEAGILATVAKVITGTPIPTRVPLHELYWRQYGVRLIDEKQRKLECDPREISPSELLQAKYEVVPYFDVTGSKSDLLSWCTSKSVTAGRLVIGPGGLGKTRLMIEVAAKLRQKGWMAGFLDRAHEQADATLRQRWQALDQLIAHGEDKGLLVILDYAEGRQDEVKMLAQRLANRPEGKSRAIRLVLLARSAGDWWSRLHDETPEVARLFRRDASSADVVALPVIATGQQRLDLFNSSMAALKPILVAQGTAPPTDQPRLDRVEIIKTGSGYARPLAIQMEALLYLASAAPEPGASGVDVLLRRVLGLERNHWDKLIGALGEDRIRDLNRGVAQVTAVAGVSTSQAAERLLMADGFYKGRRTARVDVAPVLADLQKIYGRADGGVASLEPDLVGEHHVASIGDVDLIEACLAWIASGPRAQQMKSGRHLLTVLQRATQPEHGAEATARAAALLDHIVRTHIPTLAKEIVEVMTDTPGQLRGLLERALGELGAAALRELDDALPAGHLQLLELALDVSDRHATAARMALATVEAERAAPDALQHASFEYASARNRFSGRLSDLGRREEALMASEEAVFIFRQLAEARPDVFLPTLAASVNNMGNRLSDMGRREEALEASKQAVGIYRRLTGPQPDAFLPNLAMCLNNMGNRLSDMGRREEALKASEEAVDVYRRLAATGPDAFLPKLALCLSNKGSHHSKLGRPEEALKASEEALDIRRRLAETQPDLFLSDLASSLNNVSSNFSDLDRDEEALKASEEAVDIYRRLAEGRPDAFLPDLATSLSNLEPRLANLFRYEEALKASEEAHLGNRNQENRAGGGGSEVEHARSASTSIRKGGGGIPRAGGYSRWRGGCEARQEADASPLRGTP
jgi:tetratricopeptide (TPR) repeat protein